MPKSESELPNNQVTPKHSLEKRTRRKHPPEYKLRIVAEANACKHGELGALLRREKLYSNQLADWRRNYTEHGVNGLSKSLPGPAPSQSAEQRQIDQLTKDNRRLARKLEIAHDCVDLQKKALSMLDHFRTGKDV